MDPNYSLTPSKYLLDEEQAKLRKLLEKHRDQHLRDTTLILFSLESGARPQEALNVVWGDIDQTTRSVYLRTLKRGRPRNLDISKNLLGRLMDMDGIKGPETKVFGLSYIRYYQIWQLYRPVKKKLHCLRHTFAINLYNASKYNLCLVQLALGHKRLHTTSVYLELEMNKKELSEALLRTPG